MKTIGELKKKLKQSTDTEEETFIKDDELCCYIDMAMRKAQKIVGNLCQDYFSSCEIITVPDGTVKIDLPSDISGTQIRKVFWETAKDCCPLKRLPPEFCCKDKKGDPFGYQFFNKSGEGNKLYLQPASGKAGSVRIIYNRKLASIVGQPDETELEMGEFCDFIFFATKVMIYEKLENPLINLAIAQLNEEQELLEKSLSPQFQDEESSRIETDQCWEDYVDEYC